eukprot:6195595-Pleurochrysis_carterae.AAC.1
MTCKWGHPVVTLLSDEGDYTSLALFADYIYDDVEGLIIARSFLICERDDSEMDDEDCQCRRPLPRA